VEAVTMCGAGDSHTDMYPGGVAGEGIVHAPNHDTLVHLQ